jgi:hypothetical protein
MDFCVIPRAMPEDKEMEDLRFIVKRDNVLAQTVYHQELIILCFHFRNYNYNFSAPEMHT